MKTKALAVSVLALFLPILAGSPTHAALPAGLVVPAITTITDAAGWDALDGTTPAAGTVYQLDFDSITALGNVTLDTSNATAAQPIVIEGMRPRYGASATRSARLPKIICPAATDLLTLASGSDYLEIRHVHFYGGDSHIFGPFLNSTIEYCLFEENQDEAVVNSSGGHDNLFQYNAVINARADGFVTNVAYSNTYRYNYFEGMDDSGGIPADCIAIHAANTGRTLMYGNVAVNCVGKSMLSAGDTGGSLAEMYDNVMIDCDMTGVFCQTAVAGSPAPVNVYAYNNIFVMDGDSSRAGFYINEGATCFAINNTVVNRSKTANEGINISQFGVAFAYNNIFYTRFPDYSYTHEITSVTALLTTNVIYPDRRIFTTTLLPLTDLKAAGGEAGSAVVDPQFARLDWTPPTLAVATRWRSDYVGKIRSSAIAAFTPADLDSLRIGSTSYGYAETDIAGTRRPNDALCMVGAVNVVPVGLASQRIDLAPSISAPATIAVSSVTVDKYATMVFDTLDLTATLDQGDEFTIASMTQAANNGTYKAISVAVSSGDTTIVAVPTDGRTPVTESADSDATVTAADWKNATFSKKGRRIRIGKTTSGTHYVRINPFGGTTQSAASTASSDIFLTLTADKHIDIELDSPTNAVRIQHMTAATALTLDVSILP